MKLKRLVSILILAPLCFLTGFGLTIAARLPATGQARDIGVMYLFDACGAAIGGLIATWLALHIFTPFQVGLITGLIIVFMNGALLVRHKTAQIITVCVALALAATLWFAPAIDTWSTLQAWKNYQPIVTIDSRYSNLVVTEQGDEHTLFADGVPQFSTPLTETYETPALLPLLEHPNPKRLLLINGGLSGMLANWRSIPLDTIMYAQIDPQVTMLERALMASPAAMEDDRLTIVNADAPHLLAHLNVDGCTRACFDVIILNTGEPDTAAGSRLLTPRLFAAAKNALTPNGVLVFGVFQPGNALGPEAAKLLGTIRATLGSTFEHVIVLPFDTFYFIASPSDAYLSADPQVLKERMVERGIVAPALESKYLSAIYPERIQSFDRAISDAAQGAPLNTSIRPFAYFAGMMLLASRTESAALGFLTSTANIPWPLALLLPICAVIASLYIIRKKPSYALRISSFWTLFAIGFAAMIYEIVLLVHYQLTFGLLFYQLGIIITAFMVGLSLGAYTSIRVFRHRAIDKRIIIVGLIVFAAYLPLLFYVSAISFVGANLICGIMEGFLFEATAEWMIAEHERIGHTAGWLNCADYWGSAIGSALASIIAVPLFGLVPALIIAASMPLAAAVVGTLVYRRDFQSLGTRVSGEFTR